MRSYVKFQLLSFASEPRGFQMRWKGSPYSACKNFIQIAGVIIFILLIPSFAGAESLTYHLIGIGKAEDKTLESDYEYIRWKADPSDLCIHFDFDSSQDPPMARKHIHNFDEGEVFLLLRNDYESEDDPDTARFLLNGVGFEIRLNF